MNNEAGMCHKVSSELALELIKQGKKPKLYYTACIPWKESTQIHSFVICDSKVYDKLAPVYWNTQKTVFSIKEYENLIGVPIESVVRRVITNREEIADIYEKHRND